jgi:hypothetical protein
MRSCQINEAQAAALSSFANSTGANAASSRAAHTSEEAAQYSHVPRGFALRCSIKAKLPFQHAKVITKS